MFDSLIVQPIFNVLVFIYGILPGHDFGLAVILFTFVVRMLMWPMVRKQLHNTRAMRAIQPDIKKIRAKYKGDRQKEAQMLQELYKEKGVSVTSTLGGLLVQLPILFGLFRAIRKLIADPETIADFSYGFVRDLPFIKSVIADNSLFDQSLFGIIDLSKQAYEGGEFYLPLMILAVGSALLQYYQTKQLTPDSKDSKSIRDILKASTEGKEADQSEINAAMASNMKIFFPLMTGFFAATFPGSLALYWATGSFIAMLQNKVALKGDVDEMIESTNSEPEPKAKSDKKPAKTPKAKKATPNNAKKNLSRKKRKSKKEVK